MVAGFFGNFGRAEYLSRCDDKQIVIDNDYVLARIFLFLLLFIIFLALVYFADATPSKLTTEDYGSTLLLLELCLLILTPGNKLPFYSLGGGLFLIVFPGP